eukprot:CAMPEP_0113705666 /NCGR_PEP_ID=MMETSP0038_2-20120614/27265_1 /TAXON_ID=2898 /ORGANISM="Cryptomonas paramecium" /LENGTH=119 /DNA_ID=CAMNT_0000630711 /DNA_START=111 /DNA_END=470 /DNA_ORIENTATION=+ /assembly_acc=CAM_ASM_000170
MKEQGEPGEKRGKNREGAERENKGDREMREVKNSQEPLLDAALHRAAAPRSAGRKLLRIHLVKFGRVQNRVEADGDARDAEGPENGAAQTAKPQNVWNQLIHSQRKKSFDAQDFQFANF